MISPSMQLAKTAQVAVMKYNSTKDCMIIPGPQGGAEWNWHSSYNMIYTTNFQFFQEINKWIRFYINLNQIWIAAPFFGIGRPWCGSSFVGQVRVGRLQRRRRVIKTFCWPGPLLLKKEQKLSPKKIETRPNISFPNWRGDEMAEYVFKAEKHMNCTWSLF